MRGNAHTGILHVLGVPSPQNTVDHDKIENIEFPSFLIHSPEVKNECTPVNIWSLESSERSIYISMTSRARFSENYKDLFGGIFGQRVPSDGLQSVVHAWSSDTIYLIQTNFLHEIM